VKFSSMDLLISIIEPVNKNNYQRHYLPLLLGAVIAVLVYRQ